MTLSAFRGHHACACPQLSLLPLSHVPRSTNVSLHAAHPFEPCHQRLEFSETIAIYRHSPHVTNTMQLRLRMERKNAHTSLRQAHVCFNCFHTCFRIWWCSGCDERCRVHTGRYRSAPVSSACSTGCLLRELVFVCHEPCTGAHVAPTESCPL